METISDIKRKKQDAVNALLTECKVFFAFSNEQFAKNKTPLAEEEKYVSIGAGGYIPKGNVEKLTKGLDAIEKDFKEQVNANKATRRAHIVYELANHEAFFTCDITDTLAALGRDYKRAEVLKVYNEEREKQG
jgi:hypothetical protein